MSRAEIWFLILGMGLVTYIPRAIPAALVGRLRFSPKVEKFLKLIPYTAMSALIFPGVLTADAAHPVMGLVGGAAAAILAWRRCPVMVCVLGAIAADMCLYMVL